MKCWKCKEEIAKEVCSNCGANNGTYKELEIISAVNFNLGLKYAKKSQISTAIKFLKKSIEIDSSNINSLNLLGLLHDHIGIISEASKYWILSCMANNSDNPALKYLNKVEGNLTQRERLNESIKKYNQSLLYIKQGNSDISLIQLKKAIEINPNFLQAKNLLALMYIKDRKFSQAQKLLVEVLEIDNSNILAAKYLSSLSIEQDFKKEKTTKIKAEAPISYSYTSSINEKTSISPTGTAISFLAGALVMFLLMFFIIIPAMEQENNITVTQLKTSAEEEKTTYEATIQALNSENAALVTEKDTIENQYNQLLTEVNTNKALANLEIAKTNYNNGNYIDSLTTLNDENQINTDYLDDEAMTSYTELLNKVSPKASESYYDSGRKLYNSKQYNEAISAFNNSISYGTSDVYTFDDTYYYRARSFEALEEMTDAIADYNYIIDNLTNSTYVRYSTSRKANLE